MELVLMAVCVVFTVAVIIIEVPHEEPKQARKLEVKVRMPSEPAVEKVSWEFYRRENLPEEEVKEPEVKEAACREVLIDQSELRLLASLIFAEVGCIEDDECLYACGSVVLNRVRAEDFPDTIRGVIYQDNPLQYACTVDGNLYQEPSRRCIRIAKDLLVNGSTLPEDVIYQAEFVQGSGIYKQYANMYFCYR